MLPTACVLVGGRGTRLAEQTSEVPKAMVRVAGRPFIEWPLMQLRAAGFSRVLLCTGYREEQIQEHLGSGAAFDLEIVYSSDGARPRGTLGAVRLALNYLDDAIPVLYGDTILKVDFADVVMSHLSTGNTATMTVYRNRDRGGTSNAVVRGGMVAEYGKNPPPADASWIDYGFLVLNHDAIAGSIDADLAPWLGELSRHGRLGAYEVDEPFREIGTPAALARTAAWLMAEGGDLF